MRLFVYGTLKRTFCRNFALESEQFLGPAQTIPAYRMYNVGTYPGLVHAPENGLSIQGEVWEVRENALPVLDDVEGVHEGQYIRRSIQLTETSYGLVQAYFYLWPTADCPDCGEVWDIR